MFGLDNDADVAGSASPVLNPALSADIPMFCSDWLEIFADLAGLPPFSISDFTSRVNPFVANGVEVNEVPDVVVELIPVNVVDLVVSDDGAVVLFPLDDVFHPVSVLLVVPNSEITFGAK